MLKVDEKLIKLFAEQIFHTGFVHAGKLFFVYYRKLTF